MYCLSSAWDGNRFESRMPPGGRIPRVLPIETALGGGIGSVPWRGTQALFGTFRLGDVEHTWRLPAAFCKATPGVSCG